MSAFLVPPTTRPMVTASRCKHDSTDMHMHMYMRGWGIGGPLTTPSCCRRVSHFRSCASLCARADGARGEP